MDFIDDSNSDDKLESEKDEMNLDELVSFIEGKNDRGKKKKNKKKNVNKENKSSNNVLNEESIVKENEEMTKIISELEFETFKKVLKLDSVYRSDIVKIKPILSLDWICSLK